MAPYQHAHATAGLKDRPAGKLDQLGEQKEYCTAVERLGIGHNIQGLQRAPFFGTSRYYALRKNKLLGSGNTA